MGCVLHVWLWGEVVRVGGAQEEMVAIAFAEDQLRWLQRACVAQNWGSPFEEELLHDLANWNQHTNKAHADHEHGGRVGGVYAHHAAAKPARVTKFEHNPKGKEEDKHELDHAAERIIAPLAEGLGLLLQR